MIRTFNARTLLATSALTVLASACTTVTDNPNMPSGAAAYDVIPSSVEAPEYYPIAPADILEVKVFGEPDLSFEKLRVDEAGFIQMPLIGSVKAGGKTPAQLTTEVATLLGRKYLINPQVSISVAEAAERFVSIEGEVKKPGVYEIDKSTTLLGAIARAESPLVTAKLDQIIIFRTINGQRMAARFNLKDIRGGIAPDPLMKDGDVVAVGFSAAKGIYQDILKAAPIFNAFAVIGTQ